MSYEYNTYYVRPIKVIGQAGESKSEREWVRRNRISTLIVEDVNEISGFVSEENIIIVSLPNDEVGISY